MKILITGANGFVGRALSRHLLDAGNSVFGVSSRPNECIDHVIEWVCSGRDFVGIGGAWRKGVQVDTVVHLASRVHQRNEGKDTPALLQRYRRTNVEGTLRVAEQAHASGVKRFVFVSSIKALGETEPSGAPRAWTEDDKPEPMDAYGISKHEAEQALLGFSRQSGLEVVILRPPLVYGPGVKGNFLQLMHAAARGWPLPLGRVQSKRSMIFVDNLADAIALCAHHAKAAGRIFHVSDDRDMTVVELLQFMEKGLGRQVRLLNVPVGYLSLAGRLSGRSDKVQRLVTPLRLDIHRIRRELHWSPPHSVALGLMQTAAWYHIARGEA